MSGTDDSVSSSVLPALPIEVIERILKYTFLRRSKLTPSSDPYHLNGTTSLLRVSRGFRELCLPFFYHSITITTSFHWTTFFDPEHGIFVAGEDGRKRWNYVREVQDSQHYLYQANWRKGAQLDMVVENIKIQAAVRTQILEDLHEEYEDDMEFNPASSEDLEDWIQNNLEADTIETEIRTRVEDRTVAFIEREHRTVVQELVQASYPSALRVPSDTMKGLVSIDTAAGRMERTLLEIYQASPGVLYDLPPGELCRIVGVVQSQFGSVEIRLEGFRPNYLSSLGLWIKVYGHLPGHGFSETLRAVSWSWLLPDGSLFVLHPCSPDDRSLPYTASSPSR
ncbi:hypothetical protein BDY24DRAFT_369724 [Mrakia frigida]|uniref:uncharacterized protein n=1 Tax=Mrakia frigida TaxID=29902 RepID=UPI003FCC2513